MEFIVFKHVVRIVTTMMLRAKIPLQILFSAYYFLFNYGSSLPLFMFSNRPLLRPVYETVHHNLITRYVQLTN
jgi:hypothetical protein